MAWSPVAIEWRPAYRIVPTRFPSVYIFDRVGSAEDFDALNALEAMTNDRERNEGGQIELVPPVERLFGNGAGPIMAAFTHLNPLGSRFSDGTYGVFYAGRKQDTAVAETRHHSATFLAATHESPIRIQMRLYTVNVVGEVADLRDASTVQPEVLSPNSYGESQTVGKQLRSDGFAGLVYPSVRLPGGECVAAFKTTLLRDCLHQAHLEYHWNGEQIDYVTQQVT